MATQPTTPATATPEAPKPTVELVTSRRVFANLELAGTALAAIAAAASDFDSVTFVTPGASFVDGEFVPEAPEWTAETHEIMLAPLATKTEKNAAGEVTKPARLIALVFCPIPTVDAVSADDKGLTALTEVWRKEMNHRAVRKLRGAENVMAASSEMPISLESFVTSQEGGPSGLAAFDDHWLLYSQVLAKKAPAWGARFPGGKGKAAIRGAIENSAKAKALFPELEAFGPKEESLFVRLLKGTIGAATKAGQDVTLLQAWLDTRDAQTYDAQEAATGDLDLDSLFADMGEDEATTEEGADSNDDGDPPVASEETAEAEATE